jgi:transcriptional regulator with XRE-family HTH domain
MPHSGSRGRPLRLREFRDKAFLTQAELSLKANVSMPTIARLERGDKNASFRTIKRLARALDISPEALIDDR